MKTYKVIFSIAVVIFLLHILSVLFLFYVHLPDIVRVSEVSTGYYSAVAVSLVSGLLIVLFLLILNYDVFRKESFHRGIFDNLSEALVVIDSNGMVIEVNKTFERFFSVRGNQILKTPIVDFMLRFIPNKEMAEFNRQERVRVLEKFLFPFDEEQKTFRKKIQKISFPDGSEKYIGHNIFKVELGRKTFFVNAITDVTETQELMEQLRQMNMNLEKIVAERTKELEDANIELSELNRHLLDEVSRREEAEYELKRAEQTMRALLNNLPIGVYRTTPEGRFLYANTELARILGFESVEELMQMNAFDFYSKREHRNRILGVHSKQDVAYVKAISVLMKKDRSRIIVEDYGKQVVGEVGEIYFDGVLIDVTKNIKNRMALQQSEKRFKQLISRFPELYIRMTLDGKVNLISPSCRKILGFEPKEMVGESLSKFLDNPTWFDKLLDMLRKKQVVKNLILDIVTKTNDRVKLNGNFVLVKNLKGRAVGIEAILSDVTEEYVQKNYTSVVFKLFDIFERYEQPELIAFELIKALGQLIPVRNSIFYSFDKNTNVLMPIYLFDRFGKTFEPIDVSRKTHPLIDALHSDEIRTFTSDELIEFWDDSYSPIPRQLLAIPIVSRNNIFGMICIYSYNVDILKNVSYYHLELVKNNISTHFERRFLQDSLNYQLSLLEALVESIPFPLFFRNVTRNRYEFCNEAFCQLTGKSLEQIIGNGIEDAFPPEFVSIVRKFDEAPDLTNLQKVEVDFKDPSGEEKHYLYIRKNFSSFEKNEISAVGVLIDLTDRISYERQLRSLSEFNQKILDFAPVGIFVVDKNLNFTVWNRQAQEITGYSAKEVLGNRCNICGVNYCTISDSFAPDRRKIEDEIVIVTKNGRMKKVFKIAIPIFNEKDEFEGIIETFIDITERKELEKKLQYLADVNERMISISNLSTKIKDLSALFELILPFANSITNSNESIFLSISSRNDLYYFSHIYKFTEKEFLNKEIFIPIENLRSRIFRKIIYEKQPLITNRIDGLEQFPFFDSAEIHSAIIVPVILGDRFYGLLVSVNYIILSHTDEEMGALERLALVVASNIERIHYEEELNAALVKEYQLNLMKSNFISLISHEYRTPLQAVMLSVEILEKHYERLSAEQKEMQFTRIKRAIQDMSAMIENTILYNKLSRAEELVNWEIVESKLYFESFLKDYQLYYQGKAELEYNLNVLFPKAKIDQRLLSMILSNLIGNAVKYSSNNPKVIVNVKVEESKVSCQVQDFGIGIPKDELPKIFEPFYRGKNTKTISGTGLGLSIVKNAVELMGGKIFVESEEGKGTIVTVEIPNNVE